MIGSRLKLAREAAGLSLRDLEATIDRLVSAQAIGKYERDEMMPSSTALLALASALHVSPEYLISEGQISLVGVDFRKAPEAAAKEERAVQAVTLDLVERYLKLEEVLGLPSAAWQPCQGDAFQISSVEEAEGAASALREAWTLGVDPISGLAEVLEEHGIKVIALDLPINVSGSKAMVQRENHPDVPVIVTNKNHTAERQRFTLAHELAHLVLQPTDALPENKHEKAADRFAGALLMPAEAMRQKLGKHRSSLSLGELLTLKSYFLVSLAGLVVRSAQLEIVSGAEYARRWREIKAHGYLDPPFDEPEPIKQEPPKRLERLCFRALAEGVISESKAAEILRVSMRELDSRLQAEIPH